MQKIIKKIMAAAFMAATLTIIPASYTAPVFAKESTQDKIDAAKKEAESTKEKISEAEEEKEAIEERKETTENALENLTNDLQETAEEISGLEVKIEEKEKIVKELKEDLKQAEEDLDTAEAKLQEAEDDLTAQYEAMKIRVKYMYEHGNDSTYDIFLGSKSFDDFLNKKTHIEQMEKYDRNALSEYEKEAERLEEERASVEEERDTVKEKKEQAEREQEELLALKDEADRKREKISSLVDTYSANIELTKAQAKEAEEKADALQKGLDKKNAEIETLEAQLKAEEELQKKADSGTWRDLSDVSYETSDRKLMANIIFCEAGNQPFEGQVAVGAVIMNRVKSSAFPNTIAGVVYQKGQFEPVMTGRLALALSRDEATESCYKAADAAMAGQNPIDSCLFFRTPISGINYKYRISGHIFY